jgi:hypothetical protein
VHTSVNARDRELVTLDGIARIHPTRRIRGVRRADAQIAVGIFFGSASGTPLASTWGRDMEPSSGT